MSYGNKSKANFGSCYVYYRFRLNGAYTGSLIPIGYTKGNVEVTFNNEVVPFDPDQEGGKALDYFLKQSGVAVKLPLMEQDFKALTIAMPFTTPYPGLSASVEPSGIYGGCVTGTQMSDVGNGDYDSEIGIFIRPVSKQGKDTESERRELDLGIFKAIPDPTQDVTFTYGDSFQITNVTLIGVPDDSRENGKRLWGFGPWISGEIAG